MSNLPAPGEHSHLRVSDADREHTAEVLRAAAGDGRITFEELDERLTAAYAAKTYGELTDVTYDLPQPGSGLAMPAVPGTSLPDRIGGTPAATVSVAVMSEARRAGPWVVPPLYRAFAFFGGVKLDLRDARFSQPAVTIQAWTMMGGIDIIVDEDIAVDVSGFALMGGFDHRATGPGAPGAPQVRVTGFALMGGVNVKRRGPKQLRRRKSRRGELADGQPPAIES